VYNVRGQRVATLLNERCAAGDHSVSWKADGMASGVYLLRLQTDQGRGHPQNAAAEITAKAICKKGTQPRPLLVCNNAGYLSIMPLDTSPRIGAQTEEIHPAGAGIAGAVPAIPHIAVPPTDW
jgi:hypothetical protein